MPNFYAGFIDVYRNESVGALPSADCYMVTDVRQQNLYLFPLMPGFYQTAMCTATQVTYQNIFIVPFTSDVHTMATDIFRLIKGLMYTKNKIRLIYPEWLPYSTVNPSMSGFIRGIQTRTENYTTHVGDGYLTIGFLKSPLNEVWQIKLIMDKYGILMINHADEHVVEDMRPWTRHSPYDAILMPYRQPLYGGKSAFDVANTEGFQPYARNFICAHGFSCQEEYGECVEMNLLKMPARLPV